jgi:hypothetical protein
VGCDGFVEMGPVCAWQGGGGHLIFPGLIPL